MREGKDVIRDTDPREVARYLGYHKVKPDPAMKEEIALCLEDLCRAAEPRAVWRRCALEQKEDGLLTVKALPEDPSSGILMETASRSLSRNLRGCSLVCLMAATLGPGPDLLVRRAQILNAGRMVIYQAAGAAMIETWCDEINEEIRREAQAAGLFCRPRFSPGYGDLPLSLQRNFMSALQMKKEIGVGLTDSLLMTPTKSVTAFIGLGQEKTACPREGCEGCSQAGSCSFARS